MSGKNITDLLDFLKSNYIGIVTGEHGIRCKKSFGSTNPILVRKAIAKEEKWLKAHKEVK